jgi:hypothetical protein
MACSVVRHTQQTQRKRKIDMSNATEVKRQRGRPSAFPADIDTKMAGFKLPTATLQMLAKGAAKRELTQNAIVDRAIRAFLRRDQ